jgi:deoxyribodipyrimidine photolyase
MSSTAVVLFTRDLRVHDQRALRGAADRGGTVVPLFSLDDSIGRNGAGVNRPYFLRDALADLRESLRRRGSDLVVRRGDPVEEAVRMARATAAGTIVVGDDASGYPQRRRRLDLLVDGDVASNVGNWQWVAGTGADTRPSRTFNPVRQGKRFDSDGACVRRYVPELRDVPNAYVHEPWRAPRPRRSGGYPAPIVDVTRMGSSRRSKGPRGASRV